MDDNLNIFTGRVTFCKEKRAGTNSFGTISLRIMQDIKTFQLGAKTMFISDPTIWVSVKANYNGNALQDKEQVVLNEGTAGKYIIISGAKLSDYESIAKDSAGLAIPGAPKETKFTIECSPSNCSFSNTPYKAENTSILIGYITDILGPNQIRIKIPYRAKTETKYRKADIYVEDSSTLSMNKRVLITGSVFGKTPDPSKKDAVYVVAESITTL